MVRSRPGRNRRFLHHYGVSGPPHMIGWMSAEHRLQGNCVCHVHFDWRNDSIQACTRRLHAPSWRVRGSCPRLCHWDQLLVQCKHPPVRAHDDPLLTATSGSCKTSKMAMEARPLLMHVKDYPRRDYGLHLGPPLLGKVVQCSIGGVDHDIPGHHRLCEHLASEALRRGRVLVFFPEVSSAGGHHLLHDCHDERRNPSNTWANRVQVLEGSRCFRQWHPRDCGCVCAGRVQLRRR